MTIAQGQPMLASDIINLTFFPKGTILTFSTEAWNATSAAFQAIWKICNGQSGTPNLVNRFLRGAESSGSAAGADSRSVTLQTANLPSHSHGAAGLSVSGQSVSGLSISGLSFTGGAAASAGAHTHSVSSSGTAASAGSHGHKFYFAGQVSGSNANGLYLSGYESGNASPSNTWLRTYNTYGYYASSSVESGGAHTHTTSSAGTAASAGAHTHTVTGTVSGGAISGGAVSSGSISGSTAGAGSGTAFTVDTVPAYYTVIYIMKVA